MFVFSLYQLAVMLVPYFSGGQEYDDIKDLAITADADGTGFSVDFDALLEANPDTVAWIRFDEPAIISYPVVKSADNEDYLTKTLRPMTTNWARSLWITGTAMISPTEIRYIRSSSERGRRDVLGAS